ncbi:hypothetical protein [Saliphagus infecundisoli]|uniref:Peptide chain release factor 2 n=1 Tax=Saliphagus infecundisoli TaxID=1849069 RepID=A0ABD5QB94_9EURY|nr:hypothetical protein [Saliphagus infecundisoli]
MSPRNSWSSNRVKTELDDTLETLDRLENHLLEPLTLTESIGELETTLALYDQLTETESTDG